ncbi:MAG TPA: M20/M25/M40 family metallo-hydrolase, partial [Bryobacteraceae bacterium]|nr:M20/M25/M40 family metallo-hydrolase [Bryobacteraceae bacterium]
MDPLLQWAQKNQPALIRLIRDLVECESPTDSPGTVLRCMELLAESMADISDSRIVDGSYVYDFRLPGRGDQGRILALGHADTVWPLGTLRTMKFRNREGRLWGPGVLDMKAGLAMFAFAMRGLRELDIPV